MTDGTDDVGALAPDDDAALTALLAALPDLPMPDEVAQRIAAALADQEPLSGPVPAWAAGGSDNVTVLPSPKQRDQRRRRSLGVLTGVAASLVVLVGLVMVGTHAFPGGGSTAGGSGPEMANDTRGAAPGSSATVGASLLTSTGTSYSTANLDSAVTGLVSAASAPDAPLTSLTAPPATPGQPTPSNSPPPESSFTTAKAFVANLTGLRVCLSKLARPGELPIAADAGTWSGAQAAVIVYRGDQTARVDVYVVNPACGDSGDPADHLLYFKTVAVTP